MKTKITIQNFATTALIALMLLFGFNAKAQTHVYNDATASGIFIDGGSEVTNPVSDGVNSSTTCAQSGTEWQKIEFFPTYTPVSGDKLYFSVYNPNSVTAAQIKFDYTSGSTEVWGGNVTYEAGATSGWVEHSLDLTDHVGTEINKIWLYVASGEANSAYVDNVYFHTNSVLGSGSSETDVYNDDTPSGIFIDGGSEVANPVSDAVNSSTTCAQSGTGWQKIEFFPTYTPVSGDKLYFSVYNPNSVTAAQIKFDYTSGSTEVWGGNVTYEAGATSGWVEHSLDLTDHVGNQINKIWLYVASGEANSAYIDNVYFHTSSVISAPSTQTYFYQEAVENGTIWHNGVTDISNPLSDSVNPSSIVLQNDGTASWQETQLFPSAYTIQSGDKFYISFYNPNSAANWQLRMDLSTTGSFTQISGGDPAHDSNTSSGWVEVSLDLSSYVGESISKIQLYPVAGESISISYDNIYISSASVLSTSDFLKNESKVFVGANGIVNFSKVQEDATLYIFDVKGALILKEQINGNSSKKALNKKGLYFIKLKNNLGFSNHKVLFH
ncbi:hypothetical protein BST83_01400 [Polaribacter filamentus]|uniref:Secretion system C-terminal sorting domain-containing protein n=1 Tax=Polaribacter filamentus TaxID=53483 RepID=A0A2S7L271_9FLAO|nr:hypothetical protein [Polaribacter filamentus]PQB09029.1 hypothetical protein BST83_01400 [Polaribacter filamentus]